MGIELGLVKTGERVHAQGSGVWRAQPGLFGEHKGCEVSRLIDLGLSFSILNFENGWGFRRSSQRSVPRLYRFRNWAFMRLTHD